MSLELTISASLTYSDATGVELSASASGVTSSPSSLKPSATKQSIATSETALKLGDTTAPGYVFLQNLDATNFVTVKVAASGAVMAKLDAATGGKGTGGVFLAKLGSGAQAPVAVADSGACLIDVMVVPA